MKKIGYLLFAVGVLLVVVGFFQLDKEPEQNMNNEKENYKIKVDTSKKIGDTINNEAYEYFDDNTSLVTSFVKSRDLDIRNKYVFAYPDYVKEMFLGDFYKHLGSDNFRVDVDIEEDFNINSKIEEIKEEYFIGMYDYINNSEPVSIKIDGYNAGYVKFEALEEKSEDSDFNDELYEEIFLVYIEEKERAITIVYSIDNYKFSDSFLSKLVNEIKIEKGKASYTSMTDDGQVLKGDIKQVENYNPQKRYTVSFEVNKNKYKEKDDERNSIDRITIHNLDETLTVILRMDSMNLESQEIINFYSNIIKEAYQNKNLYDLYDYDEKDVKYNEKDYHKIEMHYKGIESGKEYHHIELYYVVDTKMVLAITYISENEIDENTILDFLNFKVENNK